MGAFNTDVAKYANNLLHSKDSNAVLETAESSLENGVLTQDDKGNTILHYISTKNALNAFQGLVHFLNSKYDSSKVTMALDTPNHKGMTVAHIVMGFDSHDLVEYLVKFSADFIAENASGDRPLEISASQDKLESVKLLYNLTKHNLKNNPLCKSYRGRSLLQIALETGSEEMFRFLLQKTDLGYITKTDFSRNTILHTASQLGKKEYLSLILLKYPDFDVNRLNGNGLSAANLAYKEGFINIVVELVRYGAIISPELAHSIGYKTVENITQTIIASVVDTYGTFVGISKDKAKIQILKEKIVDYIADMRIMNKNDLNPKIYSLADHLIQNLQNISGTKITRDLDEIKKMLSPILNEFIKEAAYV
jgi:ankyrin repeat protein